MVLFLQKKLAHDVASYAIVQSGQAKIARKSATLRRKEQAIFMNLNDVLPFLIPLAIAQFALLGITLHHILTHTRYKRGTRALWLVVVILGMEFIGPILYFLIGKED